MDLVEARARGYDAGIRHPWEAARIDVVERLIRRHVSLGPRSIVIDIGCGDTFVVEQLAAVFRDSTFYAVDTAFTDELVEHYRARLNNPRIRPFPTLDAMAARLEGPAGLILLMDVIEHIEHEIAFLRDLRSRPMVGSDTTLLITVPAYQSLFGAHDTFLGHYRRYSNRTLRRRVEAAGLTVVDIGYFFASLLPLRLLQVIKERMLGGKPNAEASGLVTWQGSEASAGLMRRALVLDARLSMLLKRVGLRLPGLSNYAICVKSA
jgi:Methyltransferase domain